jgi:hypothetical protein
LVNLLTSGSTSTPQLALDVGGATREVALDIGSSAVGVTLKLLLGSSGVASSGVKVVSDTSSGTATEDKRDARLRHVDCVAV